MIDRLLGEPSAVARSDGTVHSLFPVAINAVEGEALQQWVRREKAIRTIEIGLGYGIAALFACEGLLANGDVTARHVAVDPYQATRFAGCGLQFLDEAGVAELVEHHPEESELVLPRFLAERRRFNLAFVDGNHFIIGRFSERCRSDVTDRSTTTSTSNSTGDREWAQLCVAQTTSRLRL